MKGVLELDLTFPLSHQNDQPGIEAWPKVAGFVTFKFLVTRIR